MLYHIIPYHTISYHIISCHIILYHSISDYIILYYIVSCYVISYYIMYDSMFIIIGQLATARTTGHCSPGRRPRRLYVPRSRIISSLLLSLLALPPYLSWISTSNNSSSYPFLSLHIPFICLFDPLRIWRRARSPMWGVKYVYIYIYTYIYRERERL